MKDVYHIVAAFDNVTQRGGKWTIRTKHCNGPKDGSVISSTRHYHE